LGPPILIDLARSIHGHHDGRIDLVVYYGSQKEDSTSANIDPRTEIGLPTA